jgi:hypothetical protein
MTICQGDGVLGRFAVWIGTDDAPWSAPLSNINRIKIHSDLDNAGVISVRTGTFTDSSTNIQLAPKRTLFAHGLSYVPMLLGFVSVGSVNVPINQGVVIPYGTGSFSMTIGADATNVMVNFIKLVSGGVANVSIPYTIFVFDVGVNSSGAFVRPTKINGLDHNVVSGETRFGYMSSKKRYIHKVATGRLALPRGRTISTGIGAVSDGHAGLGFRQSINGRVSQRHAQSFGSYTGELTTFTAVSDKVDI